MRPRWSGSWRRQRPSTGRRGQRAGCCGGVASGALGGVGACSGGGLRYEKTFPCCRRGRGWRDGHLDEDGGSPRSSYGRRLPRPTRAEELHLELLAASYPTNSSSCCSRPRLRHAAMLHLPNLLLPGELSVVLHVILLKNGSLMMLNV
jgi:hypothetical protein